MKQQSSPWWRAAVCAIAFLLAACSANPAPTVDLRTPTFIRPTPGSPTIRGTVTARIAPAAPSATVGPALSAAEATLLVDQAIGLVLDYSLAAPTSADLYQAAYDGAIRYLANRGLLIERSLLKLTGKRAEDAPIFRAAYRALAALVPTMADQRPLAHAAIRSAVERADQCQTYFLAPDDFTQARNGDTADPTYGGIGVTLRQTATGIIIATVYADSPAAVAGLRPGDRLVTLDNEDLGAIDAATLGQRLRGTNGTTLQLGVIRPGETQARQHILVRAAIPPPAFNTRLVPAGNTSVAYLQLTHLTPATLAELRAEIDRIASQSVQGWVLDLRDTEVGALDLLPGLAQSLLSSDRANQPLGYVVTKGGAANPIPALAGNRQGSIAILVDGGTALLGETLAAALRDAPNARLFGEPTGGCAASSGLYPLADGAGLRITLDPLLGPDRATIHTVGLRPDEFVLPDPTGTSDPVLAMALRWLQQR